jgi:hypothetical protein
MGSRATATLRQAEALRAALIAEGRHFEAEALRSLMASYRSSKQLNTALHTDNLALRRGDGLTPSAAEPAPSSDMDYPARARAHIAAIHASLPDDADYAQRVRALKQAYPFGERRYWPYQAWLKARADYLKRYDPRTPAGPLFAAKGAERLGPRPIERMTAIPDLCPFTAPLPFGDIQERAAA